VERESRKRIVCRKNEYRRLVFGQLGARFFFSSEHAICSYLYGWKEGNLVFNGEKVSALDSTRGIQAVGSKCAPRTAKFGSPRLQTVRGGHFRPINEAISKFVDPTGPFSRIEGIQVDMLVHALSNLGAKRGIKCACKAATRPASRER